MPTLDNAPELPPVPSTNVNVPLHVLECIRTALIISATDPRIQPEEQDYFRREYERLLPYAPLRKL